MEELMRLLRAAGLMDMEGWAREAFQRGVTGDELVLELEKQPTYQTRFAPVFERRAQGKTPISAFDVIDYERRVAEMEQQYGLPSGFVDTNKLLVEDVSAQEAGQRLALTADYVRSRPDVLAAYEFLFDSPEGAAMAAFIDPEKALPQLVEQLAMARSSADSSRFGFGALSVAEAQRIARSGLTVDDVSERFSALNESRELLAPLLGEGGTALSREQTLGLITGSNPEALEIIEQTRSRRRAQQQGGGGFGLSGEGIIGAGAAR